MALHDLAPELVYQVYNNLFSISDVINLSLTCHRLHDLLRSTRILSTLFAAADREYGPIEDVIMIATYNHSQPAYLERIPPPISHGLLRQVITIGRVAERFVQLYPAERWHTNFLHRRHLTDNESHRVRRALYRYWLYCEAHHNEFHPRTSRCLKPVVEERSKLLRNWSTQQLIEIEDARHILEDILTFRICPTDGTVQTCTAHLLESTIYHRHWHNTYPPPSSSRSSAYHIHNFFHSSRDTDDLDDLHREPAPQARLTRMQGWGDDISQYHAVQSLLKLTPARILHLYDHAVYKWQVEAIVAQENGGGEGGGADDHHDWFWNNGQTFSDTWEGVLRGRGVDVDAVRDGIEDGVLGVAVDWVDGDGGGKAGVETT